MAEWRERIEANPRTAYEPSDWPVGKVGLIALGTLVFLVVAPLVLVWAFPDAVSDAGRALTIDPPGPRLQTSPSADLARFRAGEEKRLDSYYWIDRRTGTVHIPIGRAMQKLAHDGIPGFPAGAGGR